MADVGGDGGIRLDRVLIVTGLLLILAPAVTLVVVYAVLLATRTVVVGQITLLQAVELYVVELLAFALFGYLLYRLTLFAVVRQSRAIERPTTEQSGREDEDAEGAEAK